MKQFIQKHKVALMLTLLAAIFAGPLSRFGDWLITSTIAVSNAFSGIYYADIGTINEFHVYGDMSLLIGQTLTYVLMVFSFLMFDTTSLKDQFNEIEQNNTKIAALTNAPESKIKKLSKSESLIEAKALLTQNAEMLAKTKKAIRGLRTLKYVFLVFVLYFFGRAFLDARIYQEIGEIERRLSKIEAKGNLSIRKTHPRSSIVDARTYNTYMKRLKELEAN